MATINGHEVEFGCIIGGHWGQYGPDRLADIAEDFGWPDAGTIEDPRTWRPLAEHSDEFHYDSAATRWEMFHDAAEHVENWLNDHADGCAVEWVDGECFIRHTCSRCGWVVSFNDDDQVWVDDNYGEGCADDYGVEGVHQATL